MNKVTQARNVAIGLVIPFLVEAAIVLPVQRFDLWLNGIWSFANFAVFAISSIAGFVFVVRPFRRYAIVIGLVYFPVMLYLLVYFSIILVGRVFGDWL